VPTNIAVYCSSSNLIHDDFFRDAAALGRGIGERGGTLVYGGGCTGLMGEVARATHAAGGRVVGVIPQAMKTVEVCYEAADELIVTRTMRERKAIMDERADAFVVLPGGFGTLEELLEILTLRLLKYHAKPIIILNTRGFFDPLLQLFQGLYDQGFARRKSFAPYGVAADPPGVWAEIDRVRASPAASPAASHP
jgi:uncharacterized protein (TIGR00730 family)